MSSDFADALADMLSEYGEPATIINRSGTTVGTAVSVFANPKQLSPEYLAEAGDNAMDVDLREFYMGGTVALENGYKIATADGTFSVHHRDRLKEGTSSAVTIALARRL